MSWAQLFPILETIESLIVIVAVIIGGVWSLFIFRILRQRERARLEIDEIQKKLHERAVVQLNIIARQEWITDLSGFYISGVVEALNNGNRMTALSYRDVPPFSATKIKIDLDGSIEFGDRFTASLADPDIKGPACASTLFPGELEHLPFIVRVNEPGLYLLAFAAELDETESRETLEGQPSNAVVYWRTTAYFVVQPSSLLSANKKLQPTPKSGAVEQ